MARLHHNEPFAARQLEDPGDRRLLAWLVRESRRDEAAVRLAFGIAVTNHFASAEVAWLGPLSSRFNHGPLRVGNTTPGPRLVPGTPELAGRLGVRLGVSGPRVGVLEWVLVRDTAAGQELTLPYPDGYRDF